MFTTLYCLNKKTFKNYKSITFLIKNNMFCYFRKVNIFVVNEKAYKISAVYIKHTLTKYTVSYFFLFNITLCFMLRILHVRVQLT